LLIIQTHRHLRNIDYLSFVMCQLLVSVLIVNRFLFFFFCCGHLQNYWNKQGRQHVPLSSLYYLDVYVQAILSIISVDWNIVFIVSTKYSLNVSLWCDFARKVFPAFTLTGGLVSFLTEFCLRFMDVPLNYQPLI